jgi:hypothetical protein
MSSPIKNQTLTDNGDVLLDPKFLEELKLLKEYEQEKEDETAK